MMYRFRMLSATLAASFILVACGNSTNESTSSDQILSETTEVASTEEKQEDTEKATLVKTKALSETTEIEETEKAVEVTDEIAEEVELLAETDAETEDAADTIDPVAQLAMDTITEVTGIDKEAHIFMFNNTDDYIEVEVREKKEEGSSPLIGKYRYMFDSQDILHMDYLTGEFIDYETTE